MFSHGLGGWRDTVRTPAALACLAILVAACGSTPNSLGREPARETLTPVTWPAAGPQVKSAGLVLDTTGTDVRIRIEASNQGLQAAWNDAVVLLRSTDRTVFTWTSIGSQPSGPSASSVTDLQVGERITFSFDPRERASDGSYTVSVIGRTGR